MEFRFFPLTCDRCEEPAAFCDGERNMWCAPCKRRRAGALKAAQTRAADSPKGKAKAASIEANWKALTFTYEPTPEFEALMAQMPLRPLGADRG